MKKNIFYSIPENRIYTIVQQERNSALVYELYTKRYIKKYKVKNKKEIEYINKELTRRYNWLIDSNTNISWLSERMDLLINDRAELLKYYNK